MAANIENDLDSREELIDNNADINFVNNPEEELPKSKSKRRKKKNKQVPNNYTLNTDTPTPISPTEDNEHSSIENFIDSTVLQDTPSDQLSAEQTEIPGAGDLIYSHYLNEEQLNELTALMTQYLSEPYSIYTYRYFLHNWPELCILVHDSNKTLVGAVVCQLESISSDETNLNRGYIAMLAVSEAYRKRNIGSILVSRAIRKMSEMGCEEVTLEAEVSNLGALRLYEKLGFIKERYLHRYYLNAVDAYRLKLCLTSPFSNLL